MTICLHFLYKYESFHSSNKPLATNSNCTQSFPKQILLHVTDGINQTRPQTRIQPLPYTQYLTRGTL